MAFASTVIREKATPSTLTLMLDTSVLPFLSLVAFKLLPQCWSLEGGSLSKSVCRPFKRNCLGSHKPSISISHNPHWFLQPEVIETSFPGTETLGWGSWCGAETLASLGSTSAVEISLPIFICHTWGHPILILHPFYQSHCDFFNPFLRCRTFIQPDFRQFSMMVALQFSCNFDVVVGGGHLDQKLLLLF